VLAMTSSRITSVAVAITALTLASTSAQTGGVTLTPTALASTIQHAAPKPRERYAYGWPVKPFRQQHPVRGFFGDPRIANDGESRQFHFGIDISAPNGTPVYATLTGTAYIHPLHTTTIGVVGSDGVEFSYWHVVPSVRTGQWVVAYRTVIGHIEEPYGHVHFSEKRDGRYLNPLRPGALGPYADDTRPTVRSVRAVGGELVAEAYDETPLAVPRPWYDLPVMPALVRWRVLGHGSAREWRTVVDFRLTIPPASAFDEIWAPGTTQNHVRAAGNYLLVLTHSLHDLPAGRFDVEVVARDTRGNSGAGRFRFDLSRP
jgi:Peptidase family M23